MTAIALTRRQQAILTHLRTHAAAGLEAPTLDELCRALGLASRGSMHKHIRALIDAGLVEPMQGRQRGVRLRSEPQPADGSLPFLGYIAAGRPIEAVDTPQALEVPSVLRGKGPCYVLQVRGDSMIDDGIWDGDWVVVESRAHARNGEMVVALIDGHETTLKRIEQRPGRILLHPANTTMHALAYTPEQVQIQGVVVGQMRSYR